MIQNLPPLEFTEKFLTDTDETGRFIVSSKRTGRRYYVEPVMSRNQERRECGSVDPATGKLMHKKGDGKYTGAVTESESMVKLENGFSKVHNCEPGMSPHAYIEMLDAEYPDKAE